MISFKQFFEKCKCRLKEWGGTPDGPLNLAQGKTPVAFGDKRPGQVIVKVMKKKRRKRRK
jgi:hypothetical protein